MRNVDVAPQETLASTLRYKLGLTGTKLGCNRGECGACTVLVNDVPSYACSVLTHSVKNMRVESVEGLEAADRKSPTAIFIRYSKPLWMSFLRSAVTAHQVR